MKGEIEARRILDRLQESIALLPLETMIESVRYPGETDFDETESMESQVKILIQKISTRASLGDKSAVSALRNIGNQAANELDLLWQSKKSNTPNQVSTFSQAEFFRCPIVKVSGDLTPIRTVLDSEKTAIETLSQDLIEYVLNYRRPASKRLWVIDTLNLLEDASEILTEHELNVSKTSVSYRHPVIMLQARCGWIKNSTIFNDRDKRVECAKLSICSAINDLIEWRFRKIMMRLVPSVTRDVASNSTEWPSTRTALDGLLLSKNVDKSPLILGASLNLGPNKSVIIESHTSFQEKKNGGRPKEYGKGTPADFAFEYVCELEKMRNIYIGHHDDDKLVWAKTIADFDENMNTPNLDKLRQDSNNPYWGTTLMFIWQMKAALLPEFPDNPKSTSACDKAVLDAWIHAAFARARMICTNDWENYTDWPHCVKNRISKGLGKKRHTAKSAVLEKLREGMTRL